jgi:hypothetical protein
MTEKRILEISRELEDLSRTAIGIQSKFSAHMSLHSAAVIEHDKDQMLEHRKAAHVLLDRLFDNGQQVQRLADEMVQLTRLQG